MEKRLYRNTSDKMLCGVCSGVADYFNLDPTLVRLGVVVLCAAAGGGILAYIIAAIIIPEKPQNM
ncbi:MAG: PspC domain-containing protein [Agathobacter sp.]|nr:PspC domain-containing protein [Agathobacter sp.]